MPTIPQLSKIIYKFVVQSQDCGHIRKCFSHSLLKMWKFSRPKDKRIALISCIYAIGVSYADVLLYTGVGHCNVYFGQVFPQPSTDKRSQPHTFFIVITEQIHIV